jgi:predicted RNase H-like HicB family nuclease
MRKPTYTVTATRNGPWWAISVRELASVHTQTRRLDKVETMAREAISLSLDAAQDSFDVAVHVELASLGSLQAPIEEATRARQAAAKSQDLSAASMRRAVAQIRGAGYTARDAGMLLGLSNQRVSQIERDE